jgi:hypothetical protein
MIRKMPFCTLLHDHTLAAASRILIVLLHIQLVIGSSWSARGGAGVAGHVLVVLSDLAHDVVEGIVDVYAVLGGCLDEVAAKGGGEFLALCKHRVQCQSGQ